MIIEHPNSLSKQNYSWRFQGCSEGLCDHSDCSEMCSLDSSNLIFPGNTDYCFNIQFSMNHLMRLCYKLSKEYLIHLFFPFWGDDPALWPVGVHCYVSCSIRDSERLSNPISTQTLDHPISSWPGSNLVTICTLTWTALNQLLISLGQVAFFFQ